MGLNLFEGGRATSTYTKRVTWGGGGGYIQRRSKSGNQLVLFSIGLYFAWFIILERIKKERVGFVLVERKKILARKAFYLSVLDQRILETFWKKWRR